VVLGFGLALLIPAVNLLVAIGWRIGLLDLGPGGARGPNHPLVQWLFETVGWEIVLGPIGLIGAGLAAGLRGAGEWIGFLAIWAPSIAIAWLVAAMTLSAVNGTLL